MRPWLLERPRPQTPVLKQDPGRIDKFYEKGRGVETIEFGEGGEDPRAQTKELEFDIPPVADMDELFVVQAEVQLVPKLGEQSPLVTSASSTSAAALSLASDDRRRGGLAKVVISGLELEGAPPSGWRLGNDVHWTGDGPVAGGLGGAAWLRFLVRLDTGGGFGPPAAAAPSFPMPGGSGLYGPALAGARLSAVTIVDGKVDAVLRFDPPLAARSVELRVVRTAAQDTLPTEAEAVTWSAQELEAHWHTGPFNLEIAAQVPSLASEAPAPVATFPGGVAINKTLWVDFSAAARSMLRTSYREVGEGRITLQLRSAAAGKLQIPQRTFLAEYRRRLGRPGAGPEVRARSEGLDVSLRGGVEGLELGLAAGLAPAKFSVTLDGRFGPSVLVNAADTGILDPAQPNAGYRVAGPVVVARYIPLDVAEAARTLTRVSLEGRGSGDCELLVAVHGGDAERVGARLGDPIALTIPSEARPRWHRAELGPVAAAPPHPGGVWIVARVTRGTFWWTAHFDAEAPETDEGLCRRSGDDGGTWDRRPGRPRAQVHQHFVDAETGEPLPEPITCRWAAGELLADVRPANQNGPSFRGEGLALLGDASLATAPIRQVAGLGEVLALAFDCRRDVDFRVLDAVMTYDPWHLTP